MEAPTHPPRRRRWFHFGLSTLLFVTLLAAVLVAWQRERLSRWVESLWPAQVAGPAKDARNPSQVVKDFLDLKGQDRRADADGLLSDPSREMNRRFGPDMPFLSALGGEPVQYWMKDAKTLENGGSVVNTVMGLGHAGVEVTWLLRDDPAGWRITGVRIPRLDDFDDQPVSLDFENEQSLRDFVARVQLRGLK